MTDNPAPFTGFSVSNDRLIPVPGQFFSELLPMVDNLNELKVILYMFWRFDQMEGHFRYLTREEFAQDERFMHSLHSEFPIALEVLDTALVAAVERGALLSVELETNETPQVYYFLNSPRGRAALQAIHGGEWRPVVPGSLPAETLAAAPNIYRLYEQHYGPLTPMIADALRDAEATYPPSWIEDAMRIAVEHNKRSWRYTAAILKRWQEEGRHGRKDRPGSEKDRRKYVEGEFADFVEH